MALCLYVCLSVTSRCSIETAELVELVSGTGASFHLSYTVLKGNSGITKDKGTSLWNFAPNSGPRKFRFGISIVETTKVDAPSVINWTVVSQLSSQHLLPATIDRWFTTVIVKLCIQHDSAARVH